MNKRNWTYLLLVVVISTATLCIGFGSKTKTTDDFIRIAAARGGLVLDANGRDANDLLKIAAVCGNSGGTLYLKNCGGFDTTDLMKIAATGNGHVVFEF